MKQRNKERIIRQAIHCIAKNPRASLKDIALAAGIGRATIYRHFKSRVELNIRLMTFAGEQLQSVVEPILQNDLPAKKKLVMMINKLIPLGSSLNVTTYLNRIAHDEYPEVKAVYERHMAQAKKLCMELKNEKVVIKDIPLAWLVASLDNLVFTAWEKVQSGDLAANDAPWLVLSTYLSGVGTQKDLTWINEIKGNMA